MRFFSIEPISESSTFYDHVEVVVNFEKVLKNKIDGQYRKKKIMHAQLS